jgi:hypothetical protein
LVSFVTLPNYKNHACNKIGIFVGRPLARRQSKDAVEDAVNGDAQTFANSTLTTDQSSNDTTSTSPSADKSASKPPPEKKKIADADTFFAQYGGDIEYFFPLISFGIPFDGEITFLGFHGFKGIFPYK